MVKTVGQALWQRDGTFRVRTGKVQGTTRTGDIPWTGPQNAWQKFVRKAAG